MRLYCLCELQRGNTAKAADGQLLGAPNRYAALLKDDPAPKCPPLALVRPMEVVAIGVQQVITDGKPNDGSPRPVGTKHYPNVDLRACQHCGARVALEG